MANTKNLQLGSANTFNFDLGLKDGASVSADWVQGLVLRGKVFHAFVGSATTPATLDASYANTDPDISLDVPDGTAILPLAIRVVVEAYGTTALFESFTLCTKTLAAASAGTAFTPINMATRQGSGSACKVFTAPTVTNGAGHADAFELGRETYAKAVTIGTADDDSSIYPSHFLWTYKEMGFAPVLHGDASMQTWVVGQATTGYIQYWWAELSENELTYS
jgi:hypothetical protein